MNGRRAALALVALLSLAAGSFFRTEPVVDEREALRGLAPGGNFGEKAGAPPLFRSGGGLVAVSSADTAPGIRGYAGPINVLIVIGSDGRIRGLKVLSHRETKTYVHYLETPAYLDRFIGKSIFDRFEVDRDVDGISRATVSVEALAKTVRVSSRAAAESAFGLRAAPGAAGGEVGRDWAWYAALLLFGGAGYVLTLRSGGRQRLRDASLAASLAVVGLYLASPFSVLHLFNLALGRWSSSALWYVLVGSTLLSLVLAGRFYCGWLCPFGALSELVARLPLRRWTVPRDLDDRWRSAKYVLLGVVTALVLLSGRVDLGDIEVYTTLFARHGSAAAWTLAGLMVAANLRVPRFWCRYLCPAAAALGAACRQDPAYVSARDCPMGNPPHPSTTECIRCNRCRKPAAETAA